MNDIWEILVNFFTQNITIGDRSLAFSPLSLLLQGFLPIAASYILYRLLFGALKKALSKSEVSEKSQKTIIQTVRWGLRLMVFVITVLVVSRLMGSEIFSYISDILGILNQPFFKAGSTEISVLTIITAIPLFYLASWIGKLVRTMIDSRVVKRLSLSTEQSFTFSTIARYGVMSIVLLIGFSAIGIDLSSIVVLFSVLGIGLGFGLQGLVSNMISGVIIFITRPVKEGDRIQVEDIEGNVISIRLMSTVVNTLANETIIIPNSSLIENPVYNHSFSDRVVTIKNVVEVAYDSDMDRVTETLTAIAHDNPFLQHGAEPMAVVNAFNASGIEMHLFTSIVDVKDKRKAFSWNNFEIIKRFREKEITIPFSQLDVHLIHQPPAPEVKER